MGSVYLALDPILDRLVAVKVFHQLEDADEARQRFVREARSAARLAHPNIVTIFDVGEDNGRPFIAMEYAPGETLHEVIQRKVPLSIANKLAIIDGIAAGLGHAHKSGLVHRDIKPANVMIGRTGEVKILDFGIAKLVSGGGITQVGMIIGSPEYMSPEQVTGAAVDHRSDIFSLGALLYELLTGAKPFGGDITTAVAKVLQHNPPPVSEVFADLPRPLDAIVQRALEKAPDRRYQDLGPLRRELAAVRDALAAGSGSASVPVTTAAAAALAEQALLLDPASAEALELLDVAAAERDRRQDLEQRIAAILAAAERSFREGATDAALRAIDEALAFAPDHAAALALKRQFEPEANAPPPVLAPTINMPAAQAAPEETAKSEPGTVIFERPAGAGQRERTASQLGARLLVVESPDPRMTDKSFDLGPQTFRIGRSEDADLRSTDVRWSRKSAEIEYHDGGFFIRDVSSNGVVLDGRRLSAGTLTPLFFGAQITIGTTRLRFAPARDISVPDLSGTTVAGRYVLDSLIRESAQGQLYAARLINLPRRVAVKLLSPDLMRYPGYKDRFKRRAEITSQLNHPHICRINDIGETTIALAGGTVVETAYLTLDLMTGGSLADRRVERELLPLQNIERWIQLIGDALDHAHAANVIHGDLKPAAIVFDGAENPYLTDFGAERGRPADVIVGTPAFMAPEQWEGSDISPQTDQFGLAVLAYYLITGGIPFDGQDHPETRRRNFARSPLPAHEEAQRKGRTDISAHVTGVLERGLAIKPEARYPSVREFVEPLVRALRGTAVPRDPNLPPRVFISYQRGPSTGWAVHLAERLQEKHGIDVFLDLQRVDAAVRFPDRLARAIEDADVFLCLLGPTTTQSDWVRHEVRLAHQYGKPMIPIFQDGYVVPNDEVSDKSLEVLFSFDGIHLLDMYREYAIVDLAKRIANTVARAAKK
jgi:serine/threonine-protein kinase